MGNKWKWNDDNFTSTYDGWGIGKPNGGNAERCSVIDGDVRGWDDVMCSSMHQVICEKGMYD